MPLNNETKPVATVSFHILWTPRAISFLGITDTVPFLFIFLIFIGSNYSFCSWLLFNFILWSSETAKPTSSQILFSDQYWIIKLYIRQLYLSYFGTYFCLCIYYFFFWVTLQSCTILSGTPFTTSHACFCTSFTYYAINYLISLWT